MLDVQDEVGLLAAVVHTGREGAPAALFALGLGETGFAMDGGLDVREAKAIRKSLFTAVFHCEGGARSREAKVVWDLTAALRNTNACRRHNDSGGGSVAKQSSAR